MENVFQDGEILVEPDPLSEDYFENNSTVDIVADTPEQGARFRYWEGDIDNVSDIYSSTTTVVTRNDVTNLTAVYSNDSNRNDIGYVNVSLKDSTTVNNNDVTIISGEVEKGFIITDVNGHIYVIISVDTVNNISTIYRMTKITKGGNIYG